MSRFLACALAAAVTTAVSGSLAVVPAGTLQPARAAAASVEVSAPASAVSSGPPVVRFAAMPSARTEQFEYGDPIEFENRRIDIGTDTTTITIDADRAAFTDTVDCTFGPGDPVWHFTAAQWAASPLVVALPPGLVPDPEFDTTFSVRCTSFDTSGSGWEIYWRLTVVESAGAVLALTEDDDLLKSHSVTDRFTSPARTVYMGDEIRITAPPTTWSFLPGAFFEFREGNVQPTDPEFHEVLDLAVQVNADGSMMRARLPQYARGFSEGYCGSTRIQLNGVSETAASATVTGETKGAVWSAVIPIVCERPSMTTSRLPLPFGLSFLRSAVTVRISTPNLQAPAGTITLRVDGRTVGSIALTAVSQGRVTVRLPLLVAGRHRIVAAYSGSIGIRGSTSAPVILRVLF